MHELHMQRLDAIANMTVGLAHELKQPLSAINAYHSVVRRLLEEHGVSLEKVDRALDAAREQAFRVSEIVDSLRQFVSRGEAVKSRESLNEVVRSACEFTDAMAVENGVNTVVRLDAKPDHVLINRVQIQQVVVNLKRNAIEAMRDCERREMIVSTRLADGWMIPTDVADTGHGLRGSVKEKLFEPFMTTKPHGLGVGLSISRSIIEAHHGKLWARDNPGGGTVFSFVLPLAEL
ncbi:sensor histidine kinase [Methylosinus sp. KRF6]|uniref:sensor histidine kinase n=1 Tax=Methylosinus sp. KRF6 TaxID=2846853 RepID=UPI00209B3A83|nr:ATP-binding protein [Methylosinus sp. KRF6]